MEDCALSVPEFKLDLTLYDGRYVNGDSLEISMCHRFHPSFHFDSVNKYDYLSSQSCLKFLFIDHSSELTYPWKCLEGVWLIRV